MLIRERYRKSPDVSLALFSALVASLATSPAGAQTSSCRTVCWPEEHRDPAGCCISSAAAPPSTARPPAPAPTDTASAPTSGGPPTPAIPPSDVMPAPPPTHPQSASEYPLRQMPGPVQSAAAGAAQQSSCSSGMLVTDDTLGHCCWPQQAWSTSRARCVGTPVCPGGVPSRGEDCAAASASVVTASAGSTVRTSVQQPDDTCDEGMDRNADTQDHCCWPGQVWSSERVVCIGVPICPPGMTTEGVRCIRGGVARGPLAESVVTPASSSEDRGHREPPPSDTSSPSLATSTTALAVASRESGPTFGWGPWLTATTVLAGGVVVGLAIHTQSSFDGLREHCANGGGCSESQIGASGVSILETATNGVLLGTGVLAVGAIIAFVLEATAPPSRGERARAIHATPSGLRGVF